MKKNLLGKHLALPLGAVLLISLSSCNLWSLVQPGGTGTTSGLQTAAKDGSTYAAPSLDEAPSGTNYSAKATSFTQFAVEQSGAGFVMPSTGKINLLVIPVIIDDFSRNATETVRSNIYKSFFGDPSDTSWESLASFYYKSSFGQLLINGTVSPWYESGYTSSELSKLTYSGKSEYSSLWTPTWDIVENATAWYAKTYNTDLSEFDSNNDGVVDAIWFVYSAPDASRDSSLDSEDFWAYTYSDLLSYETAVNNGGKISTRIPFRYSWASYDFMYEGYTSSGLDAHTFIHETGHLMGLDDYYVSSKSSNYATNYGPMGRLDMMDYNIIDHDAYSKFALGWIKPFVVTGSANIILKPSETTGQAILLPTTTNGWNGSAFDEYMLLEFYTPSLLNKKDSVSAYPGNDTQGFTESGVRIYHVDARQIEIDGGSHNYTDTVITPSSKNNYAYSVMAHSNSSSQNEKLGTALAFRLIQEIDCTHKRNFDTDYDTLINSTGTHRIGVLADNSTLFQAGDSFSFGAYSASFPKSTMNDGNAFPFTASFSAMSSDSITVSIVAK